jgi:hypothetical protein
MDMLPRITFINSDGVAEERTIYGREDRDGRTTRLLLIDPSSGYALFPYCEIHRIAWERGSVCPRCLKGEKK